jgi:hypothetical protein
MKALIFDSGTLINLSMNGLLYILEALKKNFDGKFLITKKVKYETVDRPIGINKYELGALRIADLIERGILEFPESLGIKDFNLNQKTVDFMNRANHSLKADGNWVNLVAEAEMSCLALSQELTEMGIENIISIDERTTRILAEKPENLERLMSEKLHQRIELAVNNFEAFASFRFIRSTELVYVAYKKGLIGLTGKKVLEALLYATKFKGSSVSFEEIDELKKL